MTYKDLSDKIKATIDQFYKVPSSAYIEEAQLHFIGGVLQTALHLLPFDDYNAIKKYIYETYGYDPGGCTDDQISMDDLPEPEQSNWTTKNTVEHVDHDTIVRNLSRLKTFCEIEHNSSAGYKREAWKKDINVLQDAIDELHRKDELLLSISWDGNHKTIKTADTSIRQAQDALREHWKTLVGQEGMEGHKYAALVAALSTQAWLELYDDINEYDDDYFDRQDEPDGFTVLRELKAMFFKRWEEVRRCLLS